MSTARKDPLMPSRSPRTLLPLIAASAGVLIVGLAIGAGRGSDDTSVLNTASKLLLTVGLVAFVGSCIAEAVRRRRSRPGRPDVRRVE